MKKYFIFISLLLFSFAALAQDDTPPALPSLPHLPEDFGAYDCSPAGMAALYDEMSSAYDFDFDADPIGAQAALFQLGQRYQAIALRCGYIPLENEQEELVEQTLLVVSLPDIVAALAVGADIEVALAEIESLFGDSFNGQLLYNGLAMGLDGNSLGCSTCHNGEVAPMTEGTYTRVEDIRLLEEQFVDYTVRQYIVESILHPHTYIVPEYQDVMGSNYGTRLDAQMLADIVAYLESQDQLID